MAGSRFQYQESRQRRVSDVCTPLEGGCLCGAVRYRIDAPPRWIGYCHCTSCRRSTGAPVTTFVGASVESVSFTRGERELFASSPGVRRGFCARCGTPLTYEGERFPDEIHFYVSTFDEPQTLRPEFHVYHEERLAWLDIVDSLPRHPTTTRDRKQFPVWRGARNISPGSGCDGIPGVP